MAYMDYLLGLGLENRRVRVYEKSRGSGRVGGTGTRGGISRGRASRQDRPAPLLPAPALRPNTLKLNSKHMNDLVF